MMEDESAGAALADLAFYHAPFVIGADTGLEYAENTKRRETFQPYTDPLSNNSVPMSDHDILDRRTNRGPYPADLTAYRTRTGGISHEERQSYR